MAKNYNKMAIDIVREIGGEENVKSLAHCMTRLRFIVKDEKKVNLEALKKAEGVIQVMVAAGQYQVVIGTDVGDVYDEIGKVTNINLTGEGNPRLAQSRQPGGNRHSNPSCRPRKARVSSERR